MTVGPSGGVTLGTPARQAGPGVPAGILPVGPTPVAAGAAAPAWQPWVDVQNRALSALKTQITEALKDVSRGQQQAQALFDQAVAIADQLARPLEQAAWAAFQRYMDEAVKIRAAIMQPAEKAFEGAMEVIHAELLAKVNPVQHGYARINTDAEWTRHLAQGGATIGTG